MKKTGCDCILARMVVAYAECLYLCGFFPEACPALYRRCVRPRRGAGGRTGLMGACARGVQAKGGRITGVIPKKLNVPGIAFEHCDELIVTEDMHTRKATMERLSGAYIALPGGIGTLEELLEVLTLNQLGYLSAPVVIFNQNGYYDALIGQLRACVEQEFADASCLRLFAVADTPEEAVRALQAFELPELPNKIKDAIKYDKEAST